MLVSLSGRNIDGRLRHDELRQRSDHDRVTEVLADMHRFFKHFVQPVLHTHFGELVLQV